MFDLLSCRKRAVETNDIGDMAADRELLPASFVLNRFPNGNVGQFVRFEEVEPVSLGFLDRRARLFCRGRVLRVQGGRRSVDSRARQLAAFDLAPDDQICGDPAIVRAVVMP